MNASQETEIQFNVDGRVIVGRPRPEDTPGLAELLRGGSSIVIAQSDSDTEGHQLGASDILVDVEGHAMTLRLPNAADAAAIKRALAIGALTASVAVGGFMVGTIADTQTRTEPPAVVMPAPIAHAAPIGINSDEGLADWAAQLNAEQFAQSGAGTVAPITAPVKVTTVTDDPSQDVNVGNRGHQGANQAPTQPQAPQPPRQGGSHPE